MILETIPLAKVLKDIRNNEDGIPIPFSVSFISADKNTKKGGEIIELQNAIINSTYKANSNQINSNISKSPKHRSNSTINFYVEQSNRYFKAHVDLLLTFNKKWIIW